MAQKVVWSQNAEKDFQRIVNYLMDERSDEAATSFTDQLRKKISMLEEHPFVGVVTEPFSSIRQLVVNRQYSIYYLVMRSETIIVNLLHTSQKK